MRCICEPIKEAQHLLYNPQTQPPPPQNKFSPEKNIWSGGRGGVTIHLVLISKEWKPEYKDSKWARDRLSKKEKMKRGGEGGVGGGVKSD